MANFTQRAIIAVFEEMLAELSFSKITVTALVAKCEISSNTFYYHFRDIYDLLDAWLETRKNAFFKENDDVTGWDELLKRYFQLLKDNPQLVFHVLDSISRERMEQYVFTTLKSGFYDSLKKVSEGLGASDEVIRGISDFCCYSFFGLTLEFVWSGMSMDIDSMVNRAKAIIDGIIAYGATLAGKF